MSPKFKPLVDEARLASDVIVKVATNDGNILVVSHFDADGLTSAAILGIALARLNASFHLRVIREISKTALSEVSQVRPELLIFSDIGSGSLDLIGGERLDCETVVLDHHQPLGSRFGKLVHVNPHEHGLDGTIEVSGAGVTYLVAKNISEGNVDLAALAVVGAVGDLQDKNSKRKLEGLNQSFVDDAVSTGILREDFDLILYGRQTRPVHRALAYTMTPFLPGISGSEDECVRLVQAAGIDLKRDDKWRTVSDLSMEEKQALLSEIIKTLMNQGSRGNIALNLIGHVYTLTDEDIGTPTRDAREFASLLNACGRTGNVGLGVAIAMGDRGEVMSEAQTTLATYRQKLSEQLRWISENPAATQEHNAICIIDGRDVIDENVTGSLASILAISGKTIQDKVVVVMARSKEGGHRLSARVPDSLSARGINLGLAMNLAASRHSGVGGGHSSAAGAYVPDPFATAFLETLNELISKQISVASS